MSDHDDWYSKLDRLDEQARREREAMLKRQEQERRDLDRVAIEQGLASDEHFRVVDEQLREHQREHQATIGRLAADTDAREQQAAEAAAAKEQAAREAARQSQVDMSQSKFVAGYVTDHETVAKAKQFEEDKRAQDERLQEIADQQAKGTLQPPSREAVEKAEEQRLKDDLKAAEREHLERVKREMDKIEKKQDLTPEERAAEEAEKQEALRRIAAERDEAIRAEAAARLNRMLEPHELGKNL